MFFTRSSAKTETWIASFSARPTCLAAKEEIQNGNYRIYYHYDSTSGNLIYELVDVDSENYVNIEVNPKGDLLIPSEYQGYREPPALYGGAVLYLYEKEMKLLEEGKLDEVYVSDLEELHYLMGLSPRQLDRRASIRNEFASIFDGREAIGTSSEANYQVNHSLSVAFSFEQGYNYYGEESYLVKLVLFDGKERLGMVRSNASFLSHYEKGMVYSIRNGLKVNVSRDLFSGTYSRALDFFLGRLHYKEEAASLMKSDVVSLLFILRGESVNFDGKDYVIESDIGRAGYRFAPDESLLFTPSPSSNATILSSNTQLAVFDKEKFICSLYNFRNKTVSDLFFFYRTHAPSETDLVKDLVRHYVKVEDALPDDEQPIEDNLNISLYVDLSDRGLLLFSTICTLNGHEETMEKLRDNLYFRDKLNRYASALSHLGGIVNGTVKEEESILAFLSGDLTNLKRLASVFLSDAITRLRVKRGSQINIAIAKSESNWLSLRIDSPDYDDETLEKILSAYKKKRKYLRLGDDIIVLDDPAIVEATNVQKEASLKDALYTDHLPFYTAFKLASSSHSDVGFSITDFVKEAIGSIRDYEKKRINLPDNIVSNLRPYQKSAVQWMVTLSHYGLAGILADDMGLGKTLESISFLSLYPSSRPTLVICPKSVVYNWAAEVTKWNSEFEVKIIAGTKEQRSAILSEIKRKEKTIYVVSYDTLRNDIDDFAKVKFGTVLADEAQFIKNALSKKAKAVKSLRSDIRFALTGTPIENSLSDLWSIFDFLMPGYLLDFEDFKAQYIDNDNEEQRSNLLHRITPFILRRSKTQVLKDLPSKSVEVVTLAMNEEQEKFYDASLIEARNALEENGAGFSMFPVFTRLREIAVDPPSFFEGFSERSAKFDYVLSMVEEAISSGHKLLIFSAFTRVLGNMREALNSIGVESRTISGETEAEERLRLAEAFNETDEFPVMLVSLKAGGTGLNLIGADIVIHLDPWWNPAAEEQATDRSYRIGQTRPVSVYKLVCHGSIEEKVLALQENKRGLSDSLIKEGDSLIKKLSEDDIRYLLSK